MTVTDAARAADIARAYKEAALVERDAAARVPCLLMQAVLHARAAQAAEHILAMIEEREPQPLPAPEGIEA